MRFLGNKDSILDEIENLFMEKNLFQDNYTLFDAFCGTGSVANHFKHRFDIIANDLLYWCTVYTTGRLLAGSTSFEKLAFDPIEYLNNSDSTVEGFFFKNYSPGGSKRMYLTAENAARIDYFRQQIKIWYDSALITKNEHSYLLACLIESLSLVANVAGVYGAFLKKWDSRATKTIRLVHLESSDDSSKSVEVLNEKLEDIISNVECDILYLDPPYTQNQYGTQYHLPQTLVLNDNPTLSQITGSRPTAPMRSDWSRDYKAHILFDKIVADTKARYIVFSYSTDGIMSKDYIESILKRYGKPETYTCKKILYKRYGNHKSQKKDGHSEYLFFIEKDSSQIKYESPLNYMGSKAKMIDSIKIHMPDKYEKFIDAFGGGFNVGINISNHRVIYNDVNHFVKELVESFRTYDTYEYLMYIRKMTKKFGLSKANSEAYVSARQFYNSKPAPDRDPRMLYTVLLYGFQQQLRFNSRHEFNNPVGMRWFNDRMLAKMISFSRAIKNGDYILKSEDYLNLNELIKDNDFVYMDPPYRLTRGSYNDGKRGFSGWDISTEQTMLNFCDRLNERKVKFMISYVIEHGGEFNDIINTWIEENQYRIIEVSQKNIQRKEILIVNY